MAVYLNVIAVMSVYLSQKKESGRFLNVLKYKVRMDGDMDRDG